MKKAIYAAGLLASLSLSGCATMVFGSKQKVKVGANVEGATIKVDGEVMGNTPMDVPMKRKENHSVRIEKEGYRPFDYSIVHEQTGGYYLNYVPLAVGGFITVTSEENSLVPVIVGTLGYLVGTLVDYITGASNKLIDKKINAELMKIPDKVATENSLAVICNDIKFKIPAGSKIGSIKLNGKHQSDINWEHTVNVTSSDMMATVNEDLAELGYQVPSTKDKHKQLSMSKFPKVYLVGTVEEIQYDVNDRPYEVGRSKSGNTVTISVGHDYTTNCNLKINWELFNYRNKKSIYKETVMGKALKKGEEGGKAVVFEAFENSFYTLLNNKTIHEHLLKKPGQVVEEKKEIISITKPVDLKSGQKVNEYLPELMNSVLTVKTPYSHGSGFVISEDGYVVTNFHVIEGFEKVMVTFDNGDSLEATVMQISDDLDLALLKLKGKMFKPLRMSETNQSSVGAEVYAIGTPSDINLGQTISKGIISGRRKIEDRMYIQTDVSISPGNSGGPLVDLNGNVIGVVNAKLVGSGVEGIGFAIPASEVFAALNIAYKPTAPKK